MDKEQKQSVMDFLKEVFDPEGMIQFLVIAASEQKKSREQEDP